jgi:hypothetical protein
VRFVGGVGFGIAMVVGGHVQLVRLRTIHESFPPGQQVKYLSRQGNLRNGVVIKSGDGKHWLRRPKQPDVFTKPLWEVFER